MTEDLETVEAHPVETEAAEHVTPPDDRLAVLMSEAALQRDNALAENDRLKAQISALSRGTDRLHLLEDFYKRYSALPPDAKELASTNAILKSQVAALTQEVENLRQACAEAIRKARPVETPAPPPPQEDVEALKSRIAALEEESRSKDQALAEAMRARQAPVETPAASE